jgi:transposase-like protein
MTEETRSSGVKAGVNADPEVPAKATRRRFSTEYKLRILQEADRCKGSGEIGALLRREGLYSSHVSAWRQQRNGGGLAARKRGRKGRSESEKRVEQLERENARLRKQLEQAETIISVQKKVSELLGIQLEKPSDEESS